MKRFRIQSLTVLWSALLVGTVGGVLILTGLTHPVAAGFTPTPEPPTATPVPPTVTPAPPTATPVPPTPTPERDVPPPPEEEDAPTETPTLTPTATSQPFLPESGGAAPLAAVWLAVVCGLSLLALLALFLTPNRRRG